MRSVRRRRAARVFLIDPAGRVLLLRFAMEDPDLPRSFWAAPGGGVEEGESVKAAAERELWEELRLRVPLSGPVHTLEAAWVEGGVQVYSEDTYFLGHCGGDAPTLFGLDDTERRVLRELRWWTIAELGETNEVVFPAGLPELLQTLL